MRLCLILMSAGAALAMPACTEGVESAFDSSADTGRLNARPQASSDAGPSSGFKTFGGGHGLRYVAQGYRQRRPAPLVVALPGAGGNMRGTVNRLVPHADEAGGIVLGFRQQAETWDYIGGGYGPDVEFIDAALEETFRRYSIDQERIGVLGFSDGATYALSIGVTNGDLFRHVVAFSPGFADTENPHGSPAFFITHGTEDRTLPIDRTSREIVPELGSMGYAVDYREFEGTHEIPSDLVPEALSWFTDGR